LIGQLTQPRFLVENSTILLFLLAEWFLKILIFSYIAAGLEINCGDGTEVDMSI